MLKISWNKHYFFKQSFFYFMSIICSILTISKSTILVNLETYDLSVAHHSLEKGDALKTMRKAKLIQSQTFDYLNDAALTSDPETKGSIDSALRELILSPKKRESLGENAKDKALKKFSLKQRNRKFKLLLDSLKL
jgi:hypothetical protein